MTFRWQAQCRFEMCQWTARPTFFKHRAERQAEAHSDDHMRAASLDWE